MRLIEDACMTTLGVLRQPLNLKSMPKPIFLSDAAMGKIPRAQPRFLLLFAPNYLIKAPRALSELNAEPQIRKHICNRQEHLEEEGVLKTLLAYHSRISAPPIHFFEPLHSTDRVMFKLGTAGCLFLLSFLGVQL